MKITATNERKQVSTGTCKVTVTPAQEQAPQDIFKPGSLVIDDLGQIILVTGEGDESFNFAGVKIDNSLYNPFGDYSAFWDRDSFVKFLGSILLEQ